MLLSFTVSNFLSIKDKVELNLLANPLIKEYGQNTITHTAYKNKPRQISTVRAAALYGANASGKTNVLKAITMFKRCLLSFRDSEQTFASPTLRSLIPFLLSSETQEKPCEFEVRLLLENVVYRYGFSASQSEIIEEWLFASENARERLIFTREVSTERAEQAEQIYAFGTPKKQWKSIVDEGFVRDDTLLLAVANKFNVPIAKSIIKFVQGIYSIDSQGRFDIPEEHLSLMTSLVKFADFGIDQLAFADEMPKKLLHMNLTTLVNNVIEIDADLTLEQQDELKTVTEKTLVRMAEMKEKESENREKLTFVFKKDDLTTVSMPLNSQSQGTMVFLDLFANLLKYFKNGTVLLCDEIEASLHPQLCEAFFDLFYSIKGLKAQLIFTTHNVDLLNQDIFRRDQVWITQKDRTGQTQLTSLDEFQGLRKEHKLGKQYLEGRFGGTPILNQQQKNAFLNGLNQLFPDREQL